MKLKSNRKYKFEREEAEIIVEEDTIKKLINTKINELYPNFKVTDMEFICGMGQGQGYFEKVKVTLLREEEKGKLT